jgi:hypothetical protein
MTVTGKVDGETFRWVLGGVFGLFSTVSGFWLAVLTTSINDLRRDVIILSQQQSTLTAHDEGQSKLLDKLDQRLERFEQKIDRLLEDKHLRP